MKNKMKVPWTLNKNYFMILMGSALVSFNSLLQAQPGTQNRAWLVMQNAVDFPPSGPPQITYLDYTVAPYNNFIVGVGYNSIQSPQGNRLFAFSQGEFTDEYGYQVAHNIPSDIIYAPFTPYNDPFEPFYGDEEVCIIPVPGECAKFYIVSAYIDYNLIYYSPAYTIFDASIPNENAAEYAALGVHGHGKNMYEHAIPITENHYAWHACTGLHCEPDMFFGCTKLRQPQENERYLFIANHNYLYYSIVTNSGFSVAQELLTLPSDPSPDIDGELEIFDNGNNTYKVAVPVLTTADENQVYIIPVDLTSSTVPVVGTPVIITVSSGLGARIGGIEFSPNGNYIYVTESASPYIHCYTSAGVPVTLNMPTTPSAFDLRNSMIELGYDQKLYFATDYNSTAEVLVSYSLPNAPGTGVWTTVTPPLTNTLLALPGHNYLGDQIDGEVYYQNAASLSPECCQFVTRWDKTDFTATTTNPTWTGSSNPLNGNSGNVAWIQGTLTIPAGVNITIENMTLKFGAQGKIRIMPQGKLTISGTTLTGNDVCQQMWLGVEVLGTGQTTGSSNINDNGQFIMQTLNNTQSMVEQAYYGVVNGSFDSDLHNAGGYINCNRGIFQNNFISVNLYSHNYAASVLAGYFCLVENCTFRRAGLGLWYPMTGGRPKCFISLYDVTGVADINIISSTPYRNTFYDGYLGIGCWDVRNVDVSSATFTSCQTGISSQRAASINPTQHDFLDLIFDNCFYGIALYNTQDDNILDSYFNPLLSSQSNNFYGVFMDDCKNIYIDHNHFNSIMYGVYINKSSAGNGNIYDNDFNYCWRGIHTKNQNQILQIKCNRFHNDNNSYPYSMAWFIGSNLGDQHFNQDAAGNEFWNSHGLPNNYEIHALNATHSDPNFRYYYFGAANNTTNPQYPRVNSAVIVNRLPVFVPVDCSFRNLMELAGGNPETAKTMIDSVSSDIVLQENWVSELVTWYQQLKQDSLAAEYLLTRNDEQAKKLLLPEYIVLHRHTDAQSLIDEYNVSGNDENYNYYLLNDVILAWAETGRKPQSMDSTEKATLYQVKESGTSSSVQAGNILRFVFDTVFIESNYSDTTLFRLGLYGIGGNIFLSGVYPNPVSGTSEIIYRVPDDASYAELNMYDVTGRKMFSKQLNKGADRTKIESDEWSNGCYIIELNIDNTTRERDKLVIQNGKH